MKMTTVGVRISWDDKEKLDELCRERGVTTSELLREFIRGVNKRNEIFEEIISLKEMLSDLASINIPQLVYHVVRGSVSTIESTKLQNPDTGKKLNDNVKEIAEKLTEKILNGGNQTC